METGHIQHMYAQALRTHGRSPAAVLCPKGRQNQRFAALLRHCPADAVSLLDYGCGLGDLLAYLQQTGLNLRYTGADIVQDFIASNAVAFPGSDFQLIAGVEDISGSHDIILASGVFNLAYDEDPARNLAHVEHHLDILYARANRALTVDFMTSHVDYRQPGAFHVDPARMFEFARTKLSRRVVLDTSYLPYEFCVTVLKDATIDRERGMYARS